MESSEPPAPDTPVATGRNQYTLRACVTSVLNSTAPGFRVLGTLPHSTGLSTCGLERSTEVHCARCCLCGRTPTAFYGHFRARVGHVYGIILRPVFEWADFYGVKCMFVRGLKRYTDFYCARFPRGRISAFCKYVCVRVAKSTELYRARCVALPHFCYAIWVFARSGCTSLLSYTAPGFRAMAILMRLQVLSRVVWARLLNYTAHV